MLRRTLVLCNAMETNKCQAFSTNQCAVFRKATRLNWASVSAVDEATRKAAYYHGDGKRNMLQITCSKLFHKSNFIFSFVIKVMKVMFANHQFALLLFQ